MATPFIPQPGPPPELPVVGIPAPKFADIGEQLTKGVKDAGGLPADWGQLGKILERFLTWLIGFLLSASSWIANRLARKIMEGEELADPAFKQLSETAIKDLFGVDVDLGRVGPAGQRAGRSTAARSIGEGVLQGLFGAFAGSGARALEPAATGAEQYLTTVTQLALEGWLEGWMFEALSLGQMEKFADLDDIMADVLGLGRLSRRVMAPPLTILVETPFEWKLNKIYRPKLLSASEAARQYIRGRWSLGQVKEELARQGLSDDRIEAVISAAEKNLSLADLDYLVSREIWTRDQALDHLRDQGYPREIADTLLRIEEQGRLDTYRRQIATEAVTRYVERDIDGPQMLRILETTRLPQPELDMMRQVAAVRRELRVRDLSLSDVEQGVKRGILTIDDFRATCTKLGYSMRDEQTLELLLLTEIREARAAEEARKRLEEQRAAEKARRDAEAEKRREEAARLAELREISLAHWEQLVMQGIRSLDDYRQLLTELGLRPDNVEALADLLAAKMDDRRQAEERRQGVNQEARVRRIALADVELAVRRGILAVGDYRSFLAAQGFPEEDRDVLARLLETELTEAAGAAQAREDAKLQLARRQVSLDELERAVRLGIRTLEQYRERLAAEGFSLEDADLLAALLRSQLDQDEAARRRREEIEKQLAQKKISLSDFVRAVRAGIRSVADYRALLAREGYGAEDIDLLAALVELQQAQDQEAAKRREEAERRLAEKRISLGDLERAVKLGVVPIDTYQACLAREGFSVDDQQILVLSLLAEIARVKEARQTRQQAETQLQARYLSLADFEQAVRAGLRTMAEYVAFLTGQGFTADAIQTLSGLLQMEIDQARQAAEKREQAAGELERRGLSLAQFEQAVKAGIRSIEDYQAFLAEQGFWQEDIDTLVELLWIELEKKSRP